MAAGEKFEAVSEEELSEALLEPDVYPWRPVRVEQIETHISRLFFAGDRVVKIKRPVRYGFVDHRTLASRRQSCFDEVRLNRRLSDDIYLDALPITRTDGALRLGGAGEPVEWATVMRRFPADSTLDRVLDRGERPERLAERLADRLIPFHATASRCPGDPAAQAADAERIVRENLEEISDLGSSAIFPREFALVRDTVRSFLDRHPDAIRQRARNGWIREGHGDLKCEHVVLDPPGALQVFDCVEFSLAIRCADITSDLAFLLLDLDRFDAGDVARELVECYRAAGLDLPDEMLRLYRIHRALVKVKVTGLTIERATSAPDTPLFEELAEHLHLAAASALKLDRAVIAMTGFSGTGKSVIARAIARATNAPVISTDLIRTESPIEPGDRYRPEMRLANYRRLIERARSTAAGSPVILDGAFLRDEERELAARLAEGLGLPLIFVEVTADPAIVERRIRARSRRQAPDFHSEATLEVLQAQRAAAGSSPPFWPESASVVTIDNSTDAPASLDPLFALLEARSLLRSAL